MSEYTQMRVNPDTGALEYRTLNEEQWHQYLEEAAARLPSYEEFLERKKADRERR